MNPNKTVLVTGSSRGIGRAAALKLAEDGFDVVVHCRSNKDAADGVVTEIVNTGRRARLLQFDVADRAAVCRALQDDIEANGAYYGVVLNAGLTRDAAFPMLDEAAWDEVIHTNLDGFFNVLKPCIMPMIRARQGGRIVALASIAGQIGNRGQVNYSASKGGVIAAAKALALELAKRNITVNCVAPGLIETDMTAELALDSLVPLIPMKRIGKPTEVAALVAFLFSPDAGYITRQVIGVNGGMV